MHDRCSFIPKCSPPNPPMLTNDTWKENYKPWSWIEDCESDSAIYMVTWKGQIMYNVWMWIHNPQFTIYNPQFTIHNPQSTIYILQSTIHNLQYTIYNLQSTIYNLESTTHDTNCTKREQQLTIYNLQSTIKASEVTKWWYMYVRMLLGFKCALIARLCLLSLQRNAAHGFVLTCFQDSGIVVGCEFLVE